MMSNSHCWTLLLLCAAGASAVAEDLVSGDWTWNVDGPEIYFASTKNSAGQVLMQICDLEDKRCLYAVGLQTTCKRGDSYPALASTEQGAASIRVVCGTELEGNGNLVFVENFDQVDALVRGATRIGFALPMQGDEFKSASFSLKGAIVAIDAMRERAMRGTDHGS